MFQGGPVRVGHSGKFWFLSRCLLQGVTGALKQVSGIRVTLFITYPAVTGTLENAVSVVAVR
jgi:hypothetical protein